MSDPTGEATLESAAPAKMGLFYGWYIVAATVVGISLGYSVVAVMAFGTFILPLQQEFDWTRGEISLGLTIIAIPPL